MDSDTIKPILEGDINENIHKTNVELIREEINAFIQDLRNRDTIQSDTFFETKYAVLYGTSKSLFKMILNEARKPNFDHFKFFAKLNPMLDLILQIQNSEVSQYHASEKVGVILADEFIPPHLRK